MYEKGTETEREEGSSCPLGILQSSQGERDFLQEAYFATLVVDREVEEVAV